MTDALASIRREPIARHAAGDLWIGQDQQLHRDVVVRTREAVECARTECGAVPLCATLRQSQPPEDRRQVNTDGRNR
jgi:mRNA-degrading endonuclease toxin of MazEF toxin-antitoxin module